MSASSASDTFGRTVAMPRARPSAARSASTIAELSAPWQVACTITVRSKPRKSRRANSASLPASTGVYFRSGAYGNLSPGPNTWQCASTAPGGGTNRGLDGLGWNGSHPGVTSNGMRSSASNLGLHGVEHAIGLDAPSVAHGIASGEHLRIGEVRHPGLPFRRARSRPWLEPGFSNGCGRLAHLLRAAPPVLDYALE